VTPETRYARSGEYRIAYQVVGEGPLDIVLIGGFVSHLDLGWETPPFSTMGRHLSGCGRLILFDKRGVGLSDRGASVPTLEDRMDDVRAVMDAVGSERAALVSISEGGPMSLLFAATYPERVASLVMWASFARVSLAPDYPDGVPPEVFERTYARIDRYWGSGRTIRSVIVQDAADDPALLQQFGRFERSAASPTTAIACLRFGAASDVRHVLPAISAPTLVVHRTDDPLVPIAHGRYLAAHIPNAVLREFGGATHLSASGADVEILETIEEFLVGRRTLQPVERVLKTVLFTDIVDSTARAAALGDRRWRALLDAHDALVGREVERARGELVKTTGDGVLAAFDGPARALRCAQAILSQAGALGLTLRAGLHSGECELRGADLAGIAVHIGARVASLAAPGEILATGTVADLVVGSGIQFNERGSHALKGAGDWRLLAVTP
jgi:pimeloyl-ACP methyl ester carboxylesterase